MNEPAPYSRLPADRNTIEHGCEVVPLVPAWAALLEEMTAWPEVVTHASVPGLWTAWRGSLSSCVQRTPRSAAFSLDGRFRFRLPAWCAAGADLTTCRCCGSHGRVRFRDSSGSPAFQVSLAPGVSEASIHDLVRRWSLPAFTVAPAAEIRPASEPFKAELYWLADAGALATLIASASATFSVAVTLIGSTVRHRETIRQAAVSGSSDRLLVRQAGYTLSVDRRALRWFGLTIRASHWRLTVAGPAGSAILSLGAADSNDEAAWRMALRAVFPPVAAWPDLN